MSALLALLVAVFAAVPSAPDTAAPDTAAPDTAVPDTVVLADLRAAAARDPRAVQPALLERAARLRIAALQRGRLPQLALAGQATVQNVVPRLPLALPGVDVPEAPREQVRAQLEADWAVYDGGRTRRQAALERARLAEQTAGVDAALYGLREATTEVYFAALLLQARAATLALTLQDLDARLAALRQRVDAGAALAADAAALEAELIRTRQLTDEAEADRRAALAVLADLAGVPLDPDAVLALPDLDPAPALARLQTAEAVLEAAERPEFARFAAQARRAEAEARLAASATRPVVSVFGQAGVGRPSPFDFLSDAAAEYALAGVRLRWAPFDWGRTRLDARAARLQADLARSEARAFARRLRRDAEDDRAALARLDAALEGDARMVALREEALRAARRQLDEGVLPPDVYTDRLTDLAEARLTRQRHRVERARAAAALLSAAGLFPEPAGAALSLD